LKEQSAAEAQGQLMTAESAFGEGSGIQVGVTRQ
jgi:hypothetical protein